MGAEQSASATCFPARRRRAFPASAATAARTRNAGRGSRWRSSRYRCAPSQTTSVQCSDPTPAATHQRVAPAAPLRQDLGHAPRLAGRRRSGDEGWIARKPASGAPATSSDSAASRHAARQRAPGCSPPIASRLGGNSAAAAWIRSRCRARARAARGRVARARNAEAVREEDRSKRPYTSIRPATPARDRPRQQQRDGRRSSGASSRRRAATERRAAAPQAAPHRRDTSIPSTGATLDRSQQEGRATSGTRSRTAVRRRHRGSPSARCPA
jgi:hypothetical protein